MASAFATSATSTSEECSLVPILDKDDETTRRQDDEVGRTQDDRRYRLCSAKRCRARLLVSLSYRRPSARTCRPHGRGFVSGFRAHSALSRRTPWLGFCGSARRADSGERVVAATPQMGPGAWTGPRTVSPPGRPTGWCPRQPLSPHTSDQQSILDQQVKN